MERGRECNLLQFSCIGYECQTFHLKKGMRRRHTGSRSWLNPQPSVRRVDRDVRFREADGRSAAHTPRRDERRQPSQAEQ